VITGYNTDVEHDGVVYHVQTEDKGLDSPLILSLVYAGGAILASKRSPYKDLLASGFSEAVLAERLKRQHRLICAAIHSGRLDDLKRMGSQPGGSASNPSVTIEVEDTKTEEIVSDEIEFLPLTPRYEPAPSEIKVATPIAPELDLEDVTITSSPAIPDYASTIVDDRRQSPLGQLPATDQGLVVSLLDEHDFRSGESLTLRVLVLQRSGNADKPLNNVAVSLKVLGTTFRPQIYSTKTLRNGVATVDAQIPEFTSGRAAILVRAVAHGQSTEIRRIVQPGK
jgi:hypothetical protein